MNKLTEYLKANRGQAVRLAAHLNLRPSTISQWKAVPVEHLPEVEAFTGIPRQQLLPEAFREAKAVRGNAKVYKNKTTVMGFPSKA